MASTDLKIIVVGAGIAGLSAAIALELAGFEYTVIEESLPQAKVNSDSDPVSDATTSPGTTAEVPFTTTTIGAAVQISPTALHFLHQLGIYEEIQKISKPVSGFSMNEHDMSYIGRIDYSTYKERQVFLVLLACGFFFVYLCVMSVPHVQIGSIKQRF
jgi:2-polyprenyl-6-methoxyphenol hydroxylase-like FAD-dependent oxidoreductase